MSSHTEHVNPQKEARAHVLTLTALLILTAITVGASYINFGSSTVNIVIALTIATIKATIVGLFFMHLLHDRPVNGVIAIAGFLFLGLFLLFTLIDIGSRRDAIPQKAPVVAAPEPAADAEGAAPAEPAPAAKE